MRTAVRCWWSRDFGGLLSGGGVLRESGSAASNTLGKVSLGEGAPAMGPVVGLLLGAYWLLLFCLLVPVLWAVRPLG